MDQGGKLDAWLTERQVKWVESLVSDMAGVPRGKIQPAARFEPRAVQLPIAVFGQTVNGTFHMSKDNVGDRDMEMHPDLSTLRIVPWAAERTASVLMDCRDSEGNAIEVAPRAVLERVVAGFEERGWRPIVAPEVEFYLTKPDDGSCGEDEPTDPYGTDRVHDLGDLFRDLMEYCRLQEIPLEAVSQELGPDQFEVNFGHGSPLRRADDVFHFKRTLKRAAIAHGLRASFLAKIDPDKPGSSLHIHQSVYDDRGRNVFSDEGGRPSRLFEHYLGGLQHHMASALLLFAPYPNSYRRFLNYWSSPVNLEWAVDNRTVGLRVPDSPAGDRRVENRLAGSDVNPYLAIAGTLACGYLGMTGGLAPRPAAEGSAYDVPFALHRHQYEAIDDLRADTALHEVLGEAFVALYTAVKDRECREFQERIPPWECEELGQKV